MVHLVPLKPTVFRLLLNTFSYPGVYLLPRRTWTSGSVPLLGRPLYLRLLFALSAKLVS